MDIDLLILKLFLQDTECYSKYSRHLQKKHLGILNKLYHTLHRLKEDGSASHSVESLILKFHVLYPVLGAGEQEALDQFTSQLGSLAVETGQATELLTKLIERNTASKLAQKAVEVASGSVEFSELHQILEECDLLQSEAVKDTEEFVTDDIVLLKAQYLSSPPFKFRLKTLNRIFGGLRKRTFGFIFARPESGKTQFLASEATFLAPQVGSCILWVNNEEDGTAIVPRLYQSALLRDSQAIYQHAEAARDAYVKKINGKIKLYDRPSATAKEIERVIREHKPEIVFIDQLDKVHGFDAEREDLVQKRKYQWAREVAKKYNCAVIGVCQAGGTAENKKYLDMNDVDSSKTSKQGEADWMMGLGHIDAIGQEDMRFLSVCKNKLPETPDMNPALRHAKVPVRSVSEIQIYEDVMNV